jgi:hypothetical protein
MSASAFKVQQQDELLLQHLMASLETNSKELI